MLGVTAGVAAGVTVGVGGTRRDDFSVDTAVAPTKFPSQLESELVPGIPNPGGGSADAGGAITGLSSFSFLSSSLLSATSYSSPSSSS